MPWLQRMHLPLKLLLLLQLLKHHQHLRHLLLLLLLRLHLKKRRLWRRQLRFLLHCC
jgi:hypothetical protein